ncbi:Hsp20/alpha crystallin family protein [Aquibacillus sp. 3ASR75-11]|uniref:Hsp20/alpha crystallin family protein n=1 Tax=Terrihalobacillus insolitus TaxID=2950438 RepID=A0A9X3WXY2_9BACI|nr:Hsp20/alpha crystallin family protein [Terrihalobacillus insolitus]MDC3414208.1 Hsp20/alpha crystallin family protein [Terrihalobacillus insolitus]MDC3425414.1 Hsp20/alpha crystallin family protein [Terrihalobacillus insolitus]
MDPFRNMGDWKKNLDHFFGDRFWNEFEGIMKPTIPQMNIYQKENELFCIVNIPGLNDLDNVHVYVDHATLELKGVINIDHVGGHIVTEEILQGSFERKMDLPFPVRDDKINATYGHGLLVIHLHRLVTNKKNKNRLEIRNLEDEE